MKRVKRHKVKKEMPETSTSRLRDQEHDLAHYIHDRVELMHQVFSVIKHKELKTMAPACVQHITIDDLQELCTEELLGISSKRLCAILDGADPPSDTESSSSEHMETISLDSISSDEEILSQPSSKKKHKHKKHKSRNKHKRKSSRDSDQEDHEGEDQSKASRAGLTVLELLELQARARAIRAQLQQDNAQMQIESEKTEAKSKEDSSDEVEIKEELAEVVEISSEDEKPNVEVLPVKPPSPVKEDEVSKNPKTVTKRIKDYVVTVPQQKPSRKVKLNRATIITLLNSNTNKESNDVSTNENTAKAGTAASNMSEANNADQSNPNNIKSKTKKKQKKKGKKLEKEGSDHDEITLQLSDTEKMDLLEGLDRKNYVNFTSSSEDSASSSETSSGNNSSQQSHITIAENSKDEVKVNEENNTLAITVKNNDTFAKNTCNLKDKANIIVTQNGSSVDINNGVNLEKTLPESTVESTTSSIVTNIDFDPCKLSQEESNIVIEIQEESSTIKQVKVQNISEANESVRKNNNKISRVDDKNNSETVVSNINKINKESLEEAEITNIVDQSKELSDGEIPDREEETQGNDNNVVVCISDEEGEKRKKKKKGKKSKKEKKTKKSKTDFREGADQNFFKENTTFSKDVQSSIQQKEAAPTVDDNDNDDDDDDDIYEVLEISDDSSCYEVEGISVSRMHTTAEIEALSAKIDEIHTSDTIVINEEDSIQGSLQEAGNSNEEIQNISWRDRYLGSKKVKRVLTTSNILNALRKKNKKLKKKLHESKNKTNNEADEGKQTLEKNCVLVEGSIEHFNTLEGSNKYVDPVVPQENDEEGNADSTEAEVKKVSKEMESDAKQLLKMYKRLLKYNDINKKKDPSHKKKKKHKKSKIKGAPSSEK